MDQGEVQLTEFLSALARVERAILEKSVALNEVAGVSEAEYRLSLWDPPAVAEDQSELLPGQQTQISISAYVGGSLEGAHGISWLMELYRRDSGWEVDRNITLSANQETDDVEEDLPTIVFADSGQLISALPTLVREWLEMPIPPISPPTAG